MSDKHWWFEGATVRKLGALLTKYPACRLEVRIDKAKSMTLTVRPKTAATAKAKAPPRATTLNFSHVCPPACNGG